MSRGSRLESEGNPIRVKRNWTLQGIDGKEYKMIWRYVPPPELELFSFDQDGDGWPEISGCNVEFIQKAIISTQYTTTYAKEVSEYFHGKYDADTHRKVSSGDYPSLHPAYLKQFLDEKAETGDGTNRENPKIIKIGRIITASDGMYW